MNWEHEDDGWYLTVRFRLVEGEDEQEHFRSQNEFGLVLNGATDSVDWVAVQSCVNAGLDHPYIVQVVEGG